MCVSVAPVIVNWMGDPVWVSISDLRRIRVAICPHCAFVRLAVISPWRIVRIDRYKAEQRETHCCDFFEPSAFRRFKQGFPQGGDLGADADAFSTSNIDVKGVNRLDGALFQFMRSTRAERRA
jgi:hypothetical protein